MAIDEKERARRIALWHAHGYKCFHGGCVLQLSDMQEDHLVPQKLDNLSAQERKTRLAAMGLPADFDIQGLFNLVPSCAFHNNQKSGIELEPHQIAMQLQINRRLVPDVERLIAYYMSEISLPKVIQIIRSGVGKKYTLHELLDAMASNGWSREALMEYLWDTNHQAFTTLSLPTPFTAPGDSNLVIGRHFAIIEKMYRFIGQNQEPMESVVFRTDVQEVRLLIVGTLRIFFEVEDDGSVNVNSVVDHDEINKENRERLQRNGWVQ